MLTIGEFLSGAAYEMEMRKAVRDMELRLQIEAQKIQAEAQMAILRSDYRTYSEDDPRYVHPMHVRPGINSMAEMLASQSLNKEGAERAAAVARQKREEREHNMRVWGRPDDPRLDPTSEFYDPLKLVHKDIDKESEA
jgi:hypothetical protein